MTTKTHFSFWYRHLAIQLTLNRHWYVYVFIIFYVYFFILASFSRLDLFVCFNIFWKTRGQTQFLVSFSQYNTKQCLYLF